MLSESNNELPLNKKRELLEQYGLDLDEFLSEPSPKVSLSHTPSLAFVL